MTDHVAPARAARPAARSPRTHWSVTVVALHLAALGVFGLEAALGAIMAERGSVDSPQDGFGAGIGILFVSLNFSGFAWIPYVASVSVLSLVGAYAAFVGRSALLTIAALVAWIAVDVLLNRPDPTRQLRTAIALSIGIAIVAWRWSLARSVPSGDASR
jgi:hypothetical protein